jgi:hypothetical protein
MPVAVNLTGVKVQILAVKKVVSSSSKSPVSRLKSWMNEFSITMLTVSWLLNPSMITPVKQ